MIGAPHMARRIDQDLHRDARSDLHRFLRLLSSPVLTQTFDDAAGPVAYAPIPVRQLIEFIENEQTDHEPGFRHAGESVPGNLVESSKVDQGVGVWDDHGGIAREFEDLLKLSQMIRDCLQPLHLIFGPIPTRGAGLAVSASIPRMCQ